MRSSGILIPITSLPSKYGIGTVGQEAYDFVDFLAKCKQKYWQILPIGPTGYGDSPYQSFSTYAGNPYLIDLDMLVSDGLLSRGEIEKSGLIEDPDFIDYGDLYEKRFELLGKAAVRLDSLNKNFLSFCARHSEWLGNYALFMSLKQEYGMGSFHYWPEKYRIYHTGILEETGGRLKDRMHFWSALQYLFYKQWNKFRTYANRKGVKIIGDVPIYVSPDSSDLWVNHELFQVDENRMMTNVAGCPPDFFNETGQLWGNPLYNWRYHKKQKYEWWIKRLNHAGTFFDVVRIDHFRGFSGYYSIPADHDTAMNGKWKRGPGKKLISKIKSDVPHIMIIAEDLGFLTWNVRRLLKYSGFPGMKVLQFAFDYSEDSEYLPHKYMKNSVVYTGTHDNPTTCEWINSVLPRETKFIKKYLILDDAANLTNELVKTAMDSNSNLCIIPIQDWLELGAEARINIPGTAQGNWKFRVRKEMLSEELAQKILRLTESSGRAD